MGAVQGAGERVTFLFNPFNRFLPKKRFMSRYIRIIIFSHPAEMVF